MLTINSGRVRLLQDGIQRRGPALYWMSRDQRYEDNWALIFANELAKERRSGLIVVFCLVPEFLEAGRRQYAFMIDGLRFLENDLHSAQIPFKLLLGQPEEAIPLFIEEIKASVLVSDFDPLKIKRMWKRDVAKKISIPFYEVDAHNIVPCLQASQKQEYGAHTIRPKINRLLPEYLTEFSSLTINSTGSQSFFKNDWNSIDKFLKMPVQEFSIVSSPPGAGAAHARLKEFIETRIHKYYYARNDPNAQVNSELSPYLHFGQISAQRIALTVRQCSAPSENTENYLEELIVRRELSDNFCYFNIHYDNFAGFPQWARKTLQLHSNDLREYNYQLCDLESAATHDTLWNAAQKELIVKGSIHGYLRMYWAKKILEWSESPETALSNAIYLNDKYALDGRDANGYTGCAWSIGGVHDRPWQERPIFGMIRYMNRSGCHRKFDIEQYIANIESLYNNSQKEDTTKTRR